MKNLVKSLKHGIVVWIWFILVIWISGIAYSALSSLTATTSETLTAAKWNNLVSHAVPSWSVMAFNLASCPTDWSVADWSNWTPDLRWTFIRGMIWNLNSRDVSRSLWDYQIDDFKSHNHSITTADILNTAAFIINDSSWDYIVSSDNVWANGAIKYKRYYSNNIWWTETHPKNVALLYCVKD